LHIHFVCDKLYDLFAKMTTFPRLIRPEHSHHILYRWSFGFTRAKPSMRTRIAGGLFPATLRVPGRVTTLNNKKEVGNDSYL